MTYDEEVIERQFNKLKNRTIDKIRKASPKEVIKIAFLCSVKVPMQLLVNHYYKGDDE